MNTHPARSLLHRIAWSFLCCCVTAGGVCAQTVRLRVTDSLSALPVPGALVSVISASGTSSAPAVTSPEGLATLSVNSAGVYRVRVRRIGFAPVTSGELRVVGDHDPVVTLTIPSVHIALGAVRIVERRACDRRVASPSTGAAPVWEEVRKALETSRLSRGASYVSISAVRYERLFGANGTIERVDTTATGTAATQPFAARDPALLESQGYVNGSWQTGLTFYGPDEDALLAGAFTRTHCVWLAGSSPSGATGTLVGLAFEPLAERRMPEIRGTIWVDSASSELRRVDFEYVHVPFPVDVEGVGGHVDFSHAQSGTWFVSAWTLRLPRWRLSILERSGARFAGFTETVGNATVARESRVAESGLQRTIRGTVWDSVAGRALMNGVVRIPSQGLETRTDSTGSFRFDDAAVGVYRVTVAPPEPGAPGQSTEAVADLVASAHVELSLALPSFATVWRRACSDTTPTGNRGVVAFGRITTAIGGFPDSAATVTMSWRPAAGEPMPPGPEVSAWTHADSAGRYVVCAPRAPRSAQVTLAAHDAESSTVPVSVEVGATGLVHRDLAVASADVVDRLTSDYVGVARVTGAPVVIAGLVKDSFGRPVRNARLVFAGTTDSVRSDSGGRFALRTAPVGRRLATVGALGYARARRLVDLYPGDSTFLDVRLTPLTTLATVTIKERQRVSALRDEVSHRARAGFGFITDSLTLAKMQHTWMALEVPQATVVQNGPWSWAVVVSRVTASGMINCVPAVWIDNSIAEFEQLAMVPKDGIAIIEFYSRAANVPLRYGGSARLGQSGNGTPQQRDPLGTSGVTGSRQASGGGALSGAATRIPGGNAHGDCGVVLAWTKAFLSLGSPSP